ncbi:uncharacterized protein LOC110996823 [Pieris rapae]|uniref:uncharacterized protein LOC110996823 n=1 Tax=Pieris rapae TaxID=64459 RepID=UPI001E27FADF|nr:uncharacterized protein LOC110996823 [Pieris rapae]XP_022120374.2 uncharacterized protein LOC110996823 [Pieris rapae]XP_022120375.2 uncharacterized protein LOC110996823 [Pieris rapae]XP_045489109.1 uncharacterized protein LOC110996823 [Pieris rapae]
MGSAKHATVNTEMASQKKSIKDLLKKPFQALFKKDKQKEKKEIKDEDTHKVEPIKVVPVSELLEDIKNLKIKQEEEDEFSNFTYKIIDDKRKNSEVSEASFLKERNDSQLSEDSFNNFKLNEGRRSKIDSQTSEDSGFSEKNETVDSEDDICEGRRKKKQIVLISRGPIRNQFLTPPHPYSRETECRQINQVNKQTFSGGQVIVNENTRTDNTYLSKVIELVDTNVRDYNNEDLSTFLDLADEFVNENTTENILADFFNQAAIPRIVEPPTDTLIGGFSYQNANPMEISSSNTLTEYDTLELFPECLRNPEFDTLNVFPTPPRSENVPSPISDSTVFYTNHSDYSLSPQTQTSSPMYNSDYEKCQDIPSLEDYPSWVIDEVPETTDKKTRERIPSTSMTMKQYKDMQKEIANEFSKMECCQAKRKPCKEIFEGHMSKLKMEHRKVLCQKVASLDLKTAYGVLHHILASLSNGNTEESLQLALFSLICEKVLALQPELFVQDFGLNLLKLAVLRCPKRPLLTRYLVQCIQTVIKTDTNIRTHDCVFTEVDALRDNLVIACARGGDEYSNALYELVKPSGEPALFSLHHANANGHNALHVACMTHSAQTPRYHTVHVLLEHAHIDLWRKDVKGGETALHLAVNSANCDLKLIMILFKHIERKQWYDLAHAPNLSSISPLEYARSASKSKSENFPIEVLEFLKKCRKNQ